MNRYVRCVILITAAFIFCLFTQCGYTLQHRLKDVFRSKGIFVPVFNNETDETGVETVFTNVVIRELESRREVVTSKKGEGILELTGVIKRIEHKPTALTEPGFGGLQSYRRLPTEIGVKVVIEFSLTDGSSNRPLWKKSFEGFRRVDAPVDRTFDFQAPSSLGFITLSLIEAVYPVIARDIARDVYDEMVEVF